MAAAEVWAESAQRAQAWSFRLPRCEERLALQILGFLRDRAPWLAVHGRQDWAVLVQADAFVHGFRSLRRETWPGPQVPAWLSAHDSQELDGTCPALFGPVWETPEKQGLLPACGISGLEEAAGRAPVVAIGGIYRAEQVQACREAGALGVAVLRAARRPEILQSLVQAWA